jgi:hypothetical protein
MKTVGIDPKPNTFIFYITIVFLLLLNYESCHRQLVSRFYHYIFHSHACCPLFLPCS